MKPKVSFMQPRSTSMFCSEYPLLISWLCLGLCRPFQCLLLVLAKVAATSPQYGRAPATLLGPGSGVTQGHPAPDWRLIPTLTPVCQHMTTVDMSDLPFIQLVASIKSFSSNYQPNAGLLSHECMRHSFYWSPGVPDSVQGYGRGRQRVIPTAVTPQTSWTQPRPVIRVSEIIGACVHSIYNSADSGEVTADCWGGATLADLPRVTTRAVIETQRFSQYSTQGLFPCWKHTMVNGRLNHGTMV